MNKFCVVTTINKPTKAIEVLHEKFGSNLIVVGDKKTVGEWIYKDAKYFNPLIEPFNSYARKNFGYLAAMRQGAELIYDTDDDNIPNERWKFRELVTAVSHTSTQKWCNVYQELTSHKIWARGFPLDFIRQKTELNELLEERMCPIQQGLSDESPDVDAIWRLLNKNEVYFWVNKSIWLKNSWCPFNSQTTWWFPQAFPLMYLPTTASFRMSDIWRSFVAQRCLWEIDCGIVFHSPSEVIQVRNPHNLMKDFEDEIPGYLHNDEMVEILSSLKLKQGEENMCDNLLTCYHALVNKNILPLEEINSLTQWIREYEEIAANMG